MIVIVILRMAIPAISRPGRRGAAWTRDCSASCHPEFARSWNTPLVTDSSRPPLDGSRPPVQISGPAHRRPGKSPLRDRHLWGWGVLAVAVLAVAGQWVAVELGDRPADNAGTFSEPPKKMCS